MQKYTNNVTDRSGNAVQGATVTVLTYPAGATATIYSDDGVTTASNPLTTDADGEFEFYAADGRYSLSVVYGSRTQTLTDAVLLEDPASSSDTTFSTITMNGSRVVTCGSASDYPTFSVVHPGSYAGIVLKATTNTSGYYTGGEIDFQGGVSGSTYYGFLVCETSFPAPYGGRFDFFTQAGDGTADSGRQFRVSHTPSANRCVTITGSNGSNPTIGTSAGNLSISSPTSCSGFLQVGSGTATPAGGNNTIGFIMGTSNVGIFWGSGAPTLSAAQGSIYLRTDGGASTRIYSNNNGSTGWSAITSA